MLWTIIVWIVIGLIVGALARLVVPGKENMGMAVTIVLGILGALIGGWITYAIVGDGHKIISFILSVIVGAALVVGYGAITGKRRTV